jgi:hypothetical protein
MGGAHVYRGEITHGDAPEWGPLLDAVGGAFMWMFEVELTDGTPLQAYKHIDTRRYVHLDPEGAAFVFEPPDRYRRIAVADAFAAVFAQR